jgi:predicted nucleic acid-binding protein
VLQLRERFAALTIAFAANRSVYDALYVAVAVESGRSLVTADERLVQGAAARFPVQWLGSIF